MQNFLFKEKSSKFCMLDILQTAAAACLFKIESGRIYSWVLQCEMKDNLSCIPQNNTEVSATTEKTFHKISLMKPLPNWYPRR